MVDKESLEEELNEKLKEILSLGQEIVQLKVGNNNLKSK